MKHLETILEEIKNFKPTIQEIHNIGDELKFQREYYNYINKSKKLVLKNANEHSSFYLGLKLAEKFSELTGIEILLSDKSNLAKGLSYEVLSNIEKNNYLKKKDTIKNKKNVYNLNIYYEKMYYMFKLYGFISDDYYIFELLKRNHININNDNMKIRIKSIKENCQVSHKNDSNGTFYNVEVLINEIEELLNNKNIMFLNTKEYYKDIIKYKNIKDTMVVISFIQLHKNVKNEFKKLFPLQRYCISLYLGRETTFIDTIINDKISFCSYETTSKLLQLLELDNTDFYYFIQKRIQI